MANLLLVRMTFGMLVLATFAAFFITQRLKQATPAIERVFFYQHFSPNGDGVKDEVSLRFDLPRAEDVEVALVDARGREVRRLADRRLPVGTHRFLWEGRTDAGARAPDGPYLLRVALRGQGRTITSPRTLTLDTTPPVPRVLAVTPARIVPGRPGLRGRARIRWAGPSDPGPAFTVLRVAPGQAPRAVGGFRGPRFRQVAAWDGRLRGRAAPPGVYTFSIAVRDEAGNPGIAPPTRERVAVVRGL